MADDTTVFLAVPSVWVWGRGYSIQKSKFHGDIAAYIPFCFVIFISFVLFITVLCVCLCANAV